MWNIFKEKLKKRNFVDDVGRSGVFIVNFEHISHLLLVFGGSIVTFEQAYHVCHVTMFIVCWDQAVERSNTLRNIWQ